MTAAVKVLSKADMAWQEHLLGRPCRSAMWALPQQRGLACGLGEKGFWRIFALDFPQGEALSRLMNQRFKSRSEALLALEGFLLCQ